MFSKTLCFLFLFLSGFASLAQKKGLPAQEKALVAGYGRIEQFFRGDVDSLELYSGAFERQLKAVTAQPGTLDYPFKRLDSAGCSVVTSRDGNFRVYSWDTWTGGTMHIYHELYQWRSGGRVYSALQDPGDENHPLFCSRIYTVPVKGRPHYLLVERGIYSTRDIVDYVRAVRVVGSALTDTAKLFRTRTQRLSQISVEYDLSAQTDGTPDLDGVITYDSKRQAMLIAVVDNKGRITRKRLVYKLQSDKFVYSGTE